MRKTIFKIERNRLNIKSIEDMIVIELLHSNIINIQILNANFNSLLVEVL